MKRKSKSDRVSAADPVLSRFPNSDIDVDEDAPSKSEMAGKADTSCGDSQSNSTLPPKAGSFEGQHKFLEIMEQFSAAIYVCDKDGRITYCNRAAEEIWGRKPQLGADHPHDLARMYAKDGRQLAIGKYPTEIARRERRKVSRERFAVERHDGTRRAVWIDADPWFDAAGDLSGVVTMLLDVSANPTAVESKALLAAVVESSSDAIISLNLRGKITSWNSGAEHIFGYTSTEAVGQSIALLIAPDESDETRKVLSRLKRGKRVNHYEAVRVHKDGRRILSSITVSPIRDASGRIMGVSKIIRDVTARKQAEAALRDSERRFAQFMSHLPGLAWIKDGSGRYIYANDAAVRAFQVPLSELIGKTDGELFPPATAAQFQNNDRKALEGESGIQTEETLRHDDGGIHYSLVHKFPIPASAGAPSMVGGMAIDITDRKRIENALRESEVRFRTLARHAPVGIFLTDAHGGTTFVNESWCRMTGLNAEKAAGTGWEKALHPEDRDRVMTEWTLALRKGATSSTEFRFLSGDGVITWLQGNAVPLHDVAGTLCGYIGTVMDITKRKLAEIEVQRVQDQLQLVTDTMAVAVMHCTADRRYEWVSAGCAAFLQKPRDEIVGRSIPEVIGDKAYESLRHHIDRVLVGEHVEYEALIEYSGIGPRWVKASYVPTYNGTERPNGWVAVVIDITADKRNEEKLRTSEQLYRAIGESIDYGVWICDPDGRNLYASDSFLSLLGLTQEECSGLGWTNLLHPDDVDRTIAAWQQCVKSGGVWDVEHRFRGVDGDWHPILARGVPVRDDRGEVTAWAGINLDIRRLKHVEEELRQADRRKDEFLAVLAHELRNPLAPIRTGLDVIRLAPDDRQLVADVHQMMDNQMKLVIRLIDDLMDVVRITHGVIELRKTVVDLESIVQDAVETARPVIDEVGHLLAVSLPSQPIILEVDAVRIVQVISNLLNNASKYMDPGGTIELAVEKLGDHAVVSVKDTGFGIPVDLLDKVFSMFKQLDPSCERTRRGLGIGLTLVRRLVEMHGGTVSAQSPGPGQGSTFMIRLPLPNRKDQVSETSHEVLADRTKRHRILIADDNEYAAKALAMLLATLDHDVRIVHDGQMVFEVAAEFRPDIVMLDLGMPKLDGYEAAHKIRRQPWSKDMTLAAITGWGKEEDKQKALESGFDFHLVKPVELRTLQQLLNK